MTGGEHEAEEVVADVVVEGGFEIELGPLLQGLQLAAQLLVLPVEELVSAQEVDGPVLRRRHEPGAWVVRDA